MNDYKTGQPAYLEFISKGGYEISGIYFVVDQDRWNIEIRDEEKEIIVSKRSIKIYEPDRSKWPEWVGKVN